MAFASHSRPGMGGGARRALLLTLLTAAAFTHWCAAGQAAPASDWRKLTGQLAALGSRLAGYEGNAEAVRLVKEALEQIPGVEAGTQEFIIPVLRETPTLLTVRSPEGGALLEVQVQALWPNGLYPTTCPEGLEGRLIYAANGRLTDFNGTEPQGAIALMNFDCGIHWLNGALLGAKVVVLIEPEAALRGEAESKFLKTWLDFPRYWVSKEAGEKLKALAAKGVTCTLKGTCTFVPGVAENVYGYLPGNHKDFAEELVVLGAYLDGASVVPGNAPGGEAAANVALFVETAREVAKRGSPRPVLFLVTNAHTNGLAGARYFYDLLSATDEELLKRHTQLLLDVYVLRVKRRVAERLLALVSGKDGEEAAAEDMMPILEARAAAAMKELLEKGGEGEIAEGDPLGRLVELPSLADECGLGAAFGQFDESDELADEAVDEVKKFVEIDETRTLDELVPLRIRGEEQLDEAGKKQKEHLEDLLWLALKTQAKLRNSDRYAELEAGDRKRVDQRLCVYLEQYIGDLDCRIEAAVRRLAIRQHNEGLRRHLKDLKRMIYVGLDVSSHAEKLGIFAQGFLYNQRGNPSRTFEPLAADLMRVGQETEAELGAVPESLIIDAVRRIKGRTWNSFLACQPAFDAEVATAAGEAKNTRVSSRGVTIGPVGDARVFVDTPHDTADAERLDYRNLERYRKFLAKFVPEMLQEDGLCRRLGHDDRFVNWAILRGEMVRQAGRRSVFADTNVPFGVAQWYHWTDKTFAGVRAEFLESTDFAGRFRMPGIRYYNWGYMEGAKHRENGRPEYVLDKARKKVDPAANFQVWIGHTDNYAQLVVFDGVPLAFYDLIDQRFLMLLKTLDLYDARRENKPIYYGAQVRGEPVVVVWGKKQDALKIVVREGQIGERMALLNITEEEKQSVKKLRGRGFGLEEYHTIPLTSFQAAKDMYDMDEWRLRRLLQHNIKNQRIQDLHESAGEYLRAAETKLKEKKYGEFVELVRSAWGVESRAYPDVRKTQKDTMVGVIFYLFLVLPFAFFLERLIFGFTKIEHQILGFFGFFVGTFLILEQVHPAFEIANAPMIVLLAFIMMALSGIVIGIIYGKFAAELHALQEGTKGRQSADVNRLSASAVAIRLGISNMRRRKVRTFLTCLTIIILTFTVLSFSSIVAGISKPRVSLGIEAPYTGILLRNPTWSALDTSVYPVLRNRYNATFAVAPRAWYVSENPDQPTTVEISGPSNQTFLAKAAVGMSPDETKLFGNLKSALVAGEWLSSDTGLECVLPLTVAEALGLDPEQAAARKQKVRMFGMEFVVAGVIHDERLLSITDLDGEELSPVDYQGEQSAGGGHQQARPEEVALMDQNLGKRYDHMLPGDIVILPYQTLLNCGGGLRSVAVGFPQGVDAQAEIERLLDRIERILYVGLDGESYLHSSVQKTSTEGLRNLIIPLLIASLIVFNTMVGSVYERVREIGTLSALGLAPLHIGLLFLAESLVYAVIGAISGYLLGQATAWGFSHIDMLAQLFSGLELNYSSRSTVTVTMMVMGSVLLSTLYPAAVAAHIAVPSAERHWRVPDPRGDMLAMELPFTFSPSHVTGIMAFLQSFLYAHIDSTVGNFYVREVTFNRVKTEEGKEGYGVYFMAWLTPFDLGVSQEVQLLALPELDQYVMYLVLYRMSGYTSAWVRTNKPFLNALRKQLLLWRTLGEKERYTLADEGQGLFEKVRLEEVTPA